VEVCQGGAAPYILAEGFAAYRDYGVGRSRGTMPIQLAGAIKNAGFAVNWQIIYPLALGVATFSGIVESVTRAFPLSKVATLDIKVKISGPVSYTAG